MASGDLKHKCFYMHVPKCGGTSLSEALYATVPMHKRVGVIDANATRRATALIHSDENDLYTYHDDRPTGEHVYALREGMLLTHMAWETSLIHGHILFSHKADRHFGDIYKYVSLLRDPVGRIISNFNGSVRHGLIENDFDAYLEGDIVRAHALTALRYFSGQANIAPDEEPAALELAKATAEKFSVIGFLDNLDSFCDQFSDVFGRRPKIYRYNEASSEKYVPTDAQMEQLRAMLGHELQFWDFVQERFRR